MARVTTEDLTGKWASAEICCLSAGLGQDNRPDRARDVDKENVRLSQIVAQQEAMIVQREKETKDVLRNWIDPWSPLRMRQHDCKVGGDVSNDHRVRYEPRLLGLKTQKTTVDGWKSTVSRLREKLSSECFGQLPRRHRSGRSEEQD